MKTKKQEVGAKNLYGMRLEGGERSKETNKKLFSILMQLKLKLLKSHSIYKMVIELTFM